VVAVEPFGDSNAVTIAAGPEIAPYIARKGSVCIDGVSLTVNQVEPLARGALRHSTSSRIPGSTPRSAICASGVK
jgi:riboflavin synthase